MIHLRCAAVTDYQYQCFTSNTSLESQSLKLSVFTTRHFQQPSLLHHGDHALKGKASVLNISFICVSFITLVWNHCHNLFWFFFCFFKWQHSVINIVYQNDTEIFTINTISSNCCLWPFIYWGFTGSAVKAISLLLHC